MKKTLTILMIVISMITNAQLTIVKTSAPKFKNGSVTIDTTGKKLSYWVLYKVVNGEIQQPQIGYNRLKFDSLGIGNYWLLGKSKDPNYPFNYSIDINFLIGMNNPNPCVNTTINVDLAPAFYNPNSQPQQDPNNPGFCAQYDGGCYPIETQWYIDSFPAGNMSINGCNNYLNAPHSSNVFFVVKDCNGCTGIGSYISDQLPTTYPNTQTFPNVGSGNNNGGNNNGGNNVAKIENKLNGETKIFPNPFNEEINITTEKDSQITINDIMGNNIYVNYGSEFKVNTRDFTNGMYVLEMVSNEKINRDIIIKK